MKEVSGDEEHDIFHGLVVNGPGVRQAISTSRPSE